jgi:hypothetical protein
MGLLFIPQLLSGCSHTVERSAPLTIEERAKESILAGGIIHEKIVPTLSVISMKQNRDLDRYLAEITKQIFSQDEEARHWSPQIYIVDRKRKENFYSIIPGGYVYLEKSLLKKIESDSELASIIAYYLAIERIRNEQGQQHEKLEFLNSEMDEKTAIAAVERAMNYIHGAGFDTRGLAVYFNKNREEIKDSFSDFDLIEKIETEIRKQYSLRTPVLRPMVRTDAFLKVEKELKNL